MDRSTALEPVAEPVLGALFLVDDSVGSIVSGIAGRPGKPEGVGKRQMQSAAGISDAFS